MAFDSAGNLFEADFNTGHIYEFTPGGVRSTFATGLHSPWGLAFDSAGYLDGVVAIHAVSHVPRERHATLFRRIAGWLRPGGWFLAALGSADDPGWAGQWLGVEMFFSSFDAETNLRLLGDAHLDAAQAETVTMHEPDGDATFLWVLARRT